MKRRVVAIDGIDGSGKSIFGDAVIAECARRSIGVALFSVDDFRQQVDWRRPGASESDIYYEDYYDFAALERCLEQFVAGASAVQVPTYDSIRECITGETTVSLTGVSLAVLEGVFTLRARSAANGYLCYLRTSPDQARQRIVERDMKKGRTREEVERRVRERYFPSQRRYIDAYAPEQRADLLIDNEDFRAPRIARARGDEELSELFRSALSRERAR